jgi:hypothetical protein
MNTDRIAYFVSLSPHEFLYVIRHDWWKHYLVDENNIRLEVEIWLSRDPNNNKADVLKIKCFQVYQVLESPIGIRFEQPLHLGVKSVRHWQWERSVYSFFDSNTGEELFNCQWFEVQLSSSD